MVKTWSFAFCVLLQWGAMGAVAADLRVAVAANFYQAAQSIAAQFEQQTGHRVILISGSTGKHYAQIINGAPFDIFLAADARRPELLEQKGLIITNTRAVYARGRLALWSPDPDRVDASGEVLRTDSFRHLAIADPALAPYGRAARQVLMNLGVLQQIGNRIVYGKNVSQTFQFASTGNAEIAIISVSQLASEPAAGSRWLIPESLHDPVEQELVLLRDTEPGRAFVKFMASQEGQALIAAFGYTAEFAG